jgi:pimeloyl-ACP methyl ester carboxylesterase
MTCCGARWRWKSPAWSGTNTHLVRLSPKPLAVGADRRKPATRRRHRRGWLLLSTLAAIAAVLASVPPAGARAPAESVPALAWKRCADPAQRGFQCATQRVPLDYDDTGGRTIRLALIRHRASDPGRRMGTLFYEPGGPGVPGTVFLSIAFDGFPAALRGRFDIVSWDPRGVGASTAVQCFASKDAEDRFFARSPTRNVDGFPVGPGQMMTWSERYRRFGARCERRNGRLLRHVSTVDTVRDLDLMRRRAGERKLNFLGTSYGTMVGAVYANVFPDRVRAMALDGDINPTAWSHPLRARNGGRFLPGGLRFRSDEATAKTLEAFLDLCGREDTAHCAFSAGSPEATREKFTELLARLPVDATAGQTSYAQAISGTIRDLYFKFNWKRRAMDLQRLWEKGPSALAPPASAAGSRPASEVYAGEEQELAIACGEVPSPRASAFPAIDAFARRRSGVVGPFWAWDYEPCSTWPVRSAHRYTGPWGHRTANPVLVIGNTFDPATPYRGGVAMARQLARARLLTVDGYGHTALLNPSSCVNRYESRYFIKGTLPPRGTRCRQDRQPFSPGP